MLQESDHVIYAHYIWTKIHEKYAKCIEISFTSTSSSLYETNMLKEEEDDQWRINDESTSSKGLSFTYYKCFITNNNE